MKFDEKDRNNLKKIGVTTLLDLALKLPKSFEDTSLASAPKDGHVSVAVEIKSAYRQGGGMLHAACWCEAWEQNVKIVIFNAKPWHHGAFKVGKSVFVSGKCAYAYGSLAANQSQNRHENKRNHTQIQTLSQRRFV